MGELIALLLLASIFQTVGTADLLNEKEREIQKQKEMVTVAIDHCVEASHEKGTSDK